VGWVLTQHDLSLPVGLKPNLQLFIVGWTSVQQDSPPTVGLKPNLQLFIVGWTSVQQDSPPTVGLKPDQHIDGNLTPINIKSTIHYYKDVINELQRSPQGTIF
jgi:hypothetical protein